MLNGAKQSLYGLYVGAYNAVVPALSTSKFVEEGVLTPEEFVQAGDLLVYKCPTWTWEAGDPARKVSYLPADKQYLMTKNVPCLARAESLLQSSGKESTKDIIVDDGEGGSDWIAPAFDEDPEAKDIEPDSPKKPKTNLKEGEDDEEDGEIPDMENWKEDNIVQEEDPAALPSEKDEDNILKTRTYDISITYDKFHQTPRIWLFGYDENRQPLKPVEVFSDISQDHAHKTVTIEAHPHTGVPCAFIHPCRHAAVIKKIHDRLRENGRELRVDQYLFLFLKFISAVIPTIEYDNTFAMEG